MGINIRGGDRKASASAMFACLDKSRGAWAERDDKRSRSRRVRGGGGKHLRASRPVADEATGMFHV